MENNGNYIGLKRYTESAKMFFETLRDTNLANNKHCIKSVRIRSFSSPHFPPFGLDTERYSVFSPSAGKCGPEKLRIRTLFTQGSILARLKFAGIFMMESLNLLLTNALLSQAFTLKCSVKKVFLKISQIHRKTHVFEFLFNEVAGLGAGSFIKKRLQHRCFPVNFAKFVRTPIL